MNQYKKNLKKYENNDENYDEKHEKIVAMFDIICETEFRIHIKDFLNFETIYAKLVQQYDTTNLTTIDKSLQKICRTNMIDKRSVNAYVEHFKRHDNEIKSIDQTIFDWMMSKNFRMSLSSHFNSYIFQFVHATTTNKKLFFINDMIVVLMNQDKKKNYNENKINTIRFAKFDKTIKSKDIKSKRNDKKNNRDEDSCDDCDTTKDHDRKHSFYENVHLRFFDWKFFEIKIHFAKNWSNKNDFISTSKNSKSIKKRKIKRVLFIIFIRFEFSKFSKSSQASKFSTKSSISKFSKKFFNQQHIVSMSKIRRVKVKNNVYFNNCVKRIFKTMISKNSNFYLNNDVDCHMCHDKSLFINFQSLTIAKIIEMTNDALIAIKEVDSIIFEFNVHDKKFLNTIIDVEYVFNLNYNLLSIEILKRKDCEITQKRRRLFVIDENDDEIFMIDIRQFASIDNSYILNFWKSIIKKIKTIKTSISWIEWHRRFEHFNMKNVKKFVVMNLFDVNECNKIEKLEFTKRCEVCMIDKQYRTFNHKSIRTNSLKRIIRKDQRFHIDLIEEKHIVKTSKNKRYVIIFVDDYTDYIWVYLIIKKFEYLRVLRNFIVMIKAQSYFIESFRMNNVKEKYQQEDYCFISRARYSMKIYRFE